MRTWEVTIDNLLINWHLKWQKRKNCDVFVGVICIISFLFFLMWFRNIYYFFNTQCNDWRPSDLNNFLFRYIAVTVNFIAKMTETRRSQLHLGKCIEDLDKLHNVLDLKSKRAAMYVFSILYINFGEGIRDNH